jgi:hypothetical protein
MNARIRYRMSELPHPFNPKLAAQGITAWCLVEVVEPEIGSRTEGVVAIFDLDSRAMTFMGHVIAEGLNGRLIEVPNEIVELASIRHRRSG